MKKKTWTAAVAVAALGVTVLTPASAYADFVPDTSSVSLSYQQEEPEPPESFAYTMEIPRTLTLSDETATPMSATLTAEEGNVEGGKINLYVQGDTAQVKIDQDGTTKALLDDGKGNLVLQSTIMLDSGDPLVAGQFGGNDFVLLNPEEATPIVSLEASAGKTASGPYRSISCPRSTAVKFRWGTITAL